MAPMTATAISSDPAKLIIGLASADPAERERCEHDLIALGQSGRAALLDAMESDDPQLRLGAADLILKLPFDRPDDPPGVAGFLKVYGTSVASTRVTYLPAIRSASGAAAPRILLRLVREEPSDEVRWTIVKMIRQMDRATLPGPETFDRSPSAHSPNLALAAWAWEKRDYPTAVRLYRRWLELETRQPSRDNGAADFAFEELLNVARWNREYDRVADVYRAQFARGGMSESGQFEAGVNRLDDLFALHATFGPLGGFENDVAAAGRLITRPQVLYALGRLYQNRLGQNLIADAMYRAAYAGGMCSVAARDAASEFLIGQQWDDLAEHEITAALAIDPDQQSIHSANGNLRMGLLLARRGDDLGAARHKERAMESLRVQGQGRTLTRVKGDRTYTDDEVRNQLWAEIHWHYYRAALAAGDKAEMDKRLATLAPMLPDDVEIALDVIPALIERGRKADAAKFFAKPYALLRAAADQKPDDPERMNSLAWLCARSDQHLDEALKLMTQALKAQPDNYAYLDTAAEVHFHLGNFDRAVELETRANERNPGNAFLQSQLDRFRNKSNTGSNP
jgi:tetratricopeptide (TPR) repeat protein